MLTVCCKVKKKICAIMQPFHQNGEGAGIRAVGARKRHSQVFRAPGGLPEGIVLS